MIYQNIKLFAQFRESLTTYMETILAFEHAYQLHAMHMIDELDERDLR